MQMLMQALVQDHESAAADTVIERALQGYAPEDAQQVAELVSGLMSVLPLEDPRRNTETE